MLQVRYAYLAMVFKDIFKANPRIWSMKRTWWCWLWPLILTEQHTPLKSPSSFRMSFLVRQKPENGFPITFTCVWTSLWSNTVRPGSDILIILKTAVGLPPTLKPLFTGQWSCDLQGWAAPVASNIPKNGPNQFSLLPSCIFNSLPLALQFQLLDIMEGRGSGESTKARVVKCRGEVISMSKALVLMWLFANRSISPAWVTHRAPDLCPRCYILGKHWAESWFILSMVCVQVVPWSWGSNDHPTETRGGCSEKVGTSLSVHPAGPVLLR